MTSTRSRTGFDPALVSHVHAAAVYVTIGATLGCVWLLRTRAAVLLLVVELVQAAIGLTQYHLGLPIVLVGLHLLGAALAVAAATNLMLSVRSRRIRRQLDRTRRCRVGRPRGDVAGQQTKRFRTGCASGHGVAACRPRRWPSTGCPPG